jgi:hypothetical protein
MIQDQLEIMTATGTATAECVDLPARHVQRHMDEAMLIGFFQYFCRFVKSNAAGLIMSYYLVAQFIDEKANISRLVAPSIMCPADTIS